MKRLLFTLSLLGLFLAACAPTAGRPVLIYTAQKQALIDSILETATKTQPTFRYDFWSVTGISESSVSLRSNIIPIYSAIPNTVPAPTMVWTFVARDGGIGVAVNTMGGNTQPSQLEAPFFTALDAKYRKFK
jgi:IMP dehydrogenase/GMP reductase